MAESIKSFYHQEVLVMVKKQEVLDDLLKKIDECDDLIVEISQIRYWLDDVVKQLRRKKSSDTLSKCTDQTIKF